jgi:hypothetical protein
MSTSNLWWALLAIATVVAPLYLIWILLDWLERHRSPGASKSTRLR